MAIPLESDVKPEGINQPDLYAVLANLRDVVNELRDDHATVRTLEAELKALANNMRAWIAGNALINGDPAMAVVSNFDVKVTNDLTVKFGADLVLVEDDTACDTGTAATFPATKWGIFLVSTDNAGALTATWATGTDDGGYDSEEDAIEALPAAPDGEVALGSVTVQAHAEEPFIAGTDALAGGTGGNVAAATNFYDYEPVDLDTALGEAVSASPPASLGNSDPITFSAG